MVALELQAGLEPRAGGSYKVRGKRADRIVSGRPAHTPLPHRIAATCVRFCRARRKGLHGLERVDVTTRAKAQ